MSESVPSPRGIVLSHGLLAEGLVDAVRQIVSVEEGVLIARSNRGRSPELFASELRQLIGTEPTVIFTDLPSGSCNMTAQRLYREGVPIVVVTGVNLPALLDFVINRHLPLAELGPRLLEKGRAALNLTPIDPALYARTALSNR